MLTLDPKLKDQASYCLLKKMTGRSTILKGVFAKNERGLAAKKYVCNIWMVCLELNWFVYDPSWMLHLSEFVWTLRSSVWVVFNNFLLIDATDRSTISSDQKRLFFAVNLYPHSFFVNTPFKHCTALPYALKK